MRLSFISPIACERSPVPTSANRASQQIQTSIRSALAAGKRRVSVDVLIAAVDARSRTYDDSAAATIFNSLVEAVRPILPNTRVVLPGSTAALRVRRWLTDAEINDVSVGVLGVQDNALSPDALLIIDPPCRGDGMVEVRKLLREAHGQNMPVVVHNQPREEELYKLLGYGGWIPFELVKYEAAFVLAPFALQGKQDGPPPRFVLLRQFPRKWQLWRYFGAEDDTLLGGADKERTYSLVKEYESRPTNNSLMMAVSQALKSG